MKIAALAHFFYPWRPAGSETVLLELLKAADQAGHEVVVWCTHKDAMHSWRGTEPETIYEGIRVIRVRNSIVGGQKLKSWRPDVVVSHHQHTVQAIKTARLIKARSVFLVHNSYDLNRHPLRANPDLVIWNSNHVAEALSKFGTGAEQMIFHPPITPDRHLVPSTGDAYTLINLNAHKGAELFYSLADAEPDRKFIGVIGAHGDQIVRRNIPNVTILDTNPDMKRVWSRTRVLLMPSEFESYGLTAVEAGINGIPTIAHPTAGLQENLGPDGWFADRDDLSAWQKMLGGLDDPDTYKQASGDALKLAEVAMRDTQEALHRWLDWIG